MMGALFTATRDMHHACEAHPVGQRMAGGTISPQEWADWLAAFRAVHVAIDSHYPDHMARVSYLDDDLAQLPAPRVGHAAKALADSLVTPEAIAGASYVLHGAHRRGGRVLASIMDGAGLPTSHVIYAQPGAVEIFVKGCRDRADIAQDARAVFAGLLSVMDEIQAR